MSNTGIENVAIYLTNRTLYNVSSVQITYIQYSVLMEKKTDGIK